MELPQAGPVHLYIYIYIYRERERCAPMLELVAYNPPTSIQQYIYIYTYIHNVFELFDLCVSSLRRGHADLLCIVQVLTDDPRRESGLGLLYTTTITIIISNHNMIMFMTIIIIITTICHYYVLLGITQVLWNSRRLGLLAEVSTLQLI